MKKKPLYSLIALLSLTLLASQAFAWFYNDYPEPGRPADTEFEMFGPRCDRLLIKLYSEAEGEWDALKAYPQELDLTDWPLAKPYYEQFTAPPYDERVNVESVGGEFGIRNLDMNQNNNPYLGIPQNPAYPNPVKTIGGRAVENPCSDVNFRRAILSCINRWLYVSTIIGGGFAVEQWGMLSPAVGLQYYNESFRIYPYSLSRAQSFLAAGGFKNNTVDHHRYWDLNGNNTEEPNEYVQLHFVIRMDDAHRYQAGNDLVNQLRAIGINVNPDYVDVTGARVTWFSLKNAHLYTAGWSLGIYPTSIAMWMGDAGLPLNPDGTSDYSYYWHPGTCQNTAYANDATFNINARIVEIANGEAASIAAMDICNMQAARQALNGPMFVYSSTMANARTYAGGTPDEADYVGLPWKGMVMVTGYGSDSYFGMLNMHPEGYPRPADGTIRYGFKTTDIRLFNTLYADMRWDNKVLDLLYDPLVVSDPYALTQGLPWLCEEYTVGTYFNGRLGPCTKINFTLRNDAQWTDGTPITVADIHFTLVEVDDLLKARGLPRPWWYSSVKSILDFKMYDPCSFEVLLDVKSIWALGLAGAGVRIMPEHIWRPILCTAPPSVVQGPTPDANMISSSAWRFREYISTAYVELVANTPGRTVATSFAGSIPITADRGFFRYYPKYVSIHGPEYRAKIDPGYPNTHVDVTLTAVDHNLLQDQFDFAWIGGPHPGSPVNDTLEFYELGCQWKVLDWIDGNEPDYPPDGSLSVCDMIRIQGTAPVTPPLWVHVQAFPAPNMLQVGQVLEANKYVYVDDIMQTMGAWRIGQQITMQNTTIVNSSRPLYSTWLEIVPTLGRTWQLDSFELDTPPLGLNTSDIINLFDDSELMHVGIIEARNVTVGGTLQIIGTILSLTEMEKPCHPITETLTVNLDIGYHEARVEKLITTEWLLMQNNVVVANPWYGALMEAEWPIWVTILEDIAGDYYLNPNLPAPDFFVDITDVATAAFAYDTYPGDARWSPIAEITGDYWIEETDVAMIAYMFGWD